MNLKAYRQRSGYGQRVKWSRNAVAAKARKRVERMEAPATSETPYVPPKAEKLKSATVSIQCGSERVSFRVIRYDAKRLMMRGKVQAAATIGKRVALVLDSVL